MSIDVREEIVNIDQEIAKTQRDLRIFLGSRRKYENEILDRKRKIAELKLKKEELEKRI